MKALHIIPSHLLIAFLSIVFSSNSLAQTLTVTGEQKKWHPVTITLDGPQASEDGNPNPFLDYKFEVHFSLAAETITVPGYFAADGNAAETGATSGNKWRVHFVPPYAGNWTYRTTFRQGTDAALSTDPNAGSPLSPYDNLFESLQIGETDKGGDDFRGKGTLRHVGEHYMQFDNGEYYIKGGADSPENFLAYLEFDQTYNLNGVDYTKTYSPHVADWNEGDPVWQGTKGKGIIGAVNYLASEGINSVYFITLNITGDTEDVWMYTNPSERLRFDVSKLDQWNIVFDHMDRKGIVLHVLTQETENELLLDGGFLGREKMAYLRELVARFGYHHGLVWNLGEENDENTDAQRKSFADYIRAFDAYDHPIVIHTFPGKWQEVYGPFLGYPNFEGPSIQIGLPEDAHWITLDWVNQSANSGKKWLVTIDEAGPWQDGAKPDGPGNNHDQLRREILWGNYMAGGAGVEWYFGFEHPHSDFTLEDFRSRDNFWDYTRYALEFFENHIPFHEMSGNDDLASNENAYVFAKEDAVYAVYLKWGGTTTLNLNGSSKTYTVKWYNPRSGGALINGTVLEVTGPGTVSIGQPPSDQSSDWVALVEEKVENLYGDVSGDGDVTAFDASLVLQHAIGLIVLPQSLVTIADVSGNGEVSAFDGSMILQRVIELISCFPADPQCAGKASLSQQRVVPHVYWEEAMSEDGKRTLTLVHQPDNSRSQSIDLSVQFDASRYTLDRYEYTLPSNWQVFTNEEAGRLQLAGAGGKEHLEPELIKVYLTPTVHHVNSGPVKGHVSLDESPQGIATAEDDKNTPNTFELSGNYPNPFNPETTISYFLPDEALVSLEVFDLTGRSVAVLVDNANQAQGEYTVNFDASSLPSGIYIYRLDANGFQETRKMTLLK